MANKKIRYFFIFQWILISAIIFYLSHQNSLDFLPQSILSYDKFLHFLAYFVYGISTLSMLVCVKKTEKRLSVVGFALSVLFAISDEVHQFFVPNRIMDVYDLFADLFGILSSILFFKLILKNKLLNFIKVGKQ